MTNEQIKHCLGVNCDREVCEECDFYKICSHEQQEEVARIAIEAIEFKENIENILKEVYLDISNEKNIITIDTKIDDLPAIVASKFRQKVLEKM